jgi:hypothetical protein
VLPQLSFKTRYIAINTAALRGLLNLAWPEDKRKKKENQKRPAVFQLSAEDEDESKLWHSVFRLKLLHGVQVPDTSAAASASAAADGGGPKRRFGFFMSTDGLGCSFKCERPKHEAATANTPGSVFMGKNTKFRAIDPGKSGLMGVDKTLNVSPGEDGQMGWPDGR